MLLSYYITQMIVFSIIKSCHYFSQDRNSSLYYMLGLLDWRIRLLKLLSEIFNKKGKTVRIVVGSVITSDKQAEFTDIHRFEEFLRHEVYSETMNSISPKS